jgi:hypothetical protein
MVTVYVPGYGLFDCPDNESTAGVLRYMWRSNGVFYAGRQSLINAIFPHLTR